MMQLPQIAGNRMLIPLLMVSCLSPGYACADAAASAPGASGPISVVSAWSRPTPGGATVGVVYFEVVNSGAADTLAAIACAAAERTEMHATTRAGDLIKMRPVASVDIPAGGRVSFQPGGLHAMLVGLKAPLQEGGRLPCTLDFQKAGKLN